MAQGTQAQAPAGENQMLDILTGLERAQKVVQNLFNAKVYNVRKVTILGQEPMFMFEDEAEKSPPASTVTARR